MLFTFLIVAVVHESFSILHCLRAQNKIPGLQFLEKACKLAEYNIGHHL